VKKVTYANGLWGSIETISSNGNYAAQLCLNDGQVFYPQVALFSTKQGPPYSLISYPFYTYPSTKIAVRKGWNLVSIPRVQMNYTAEVVFPNALGSVFGYDPTVGDYKEVTTLELGQGYWICYQIADTIIINGVAPAPNTITIECKKGWNIIGSRETPVLVTNLQVSAGSILGGAIKYDPSIGDYAEATVINPGDAIWIYVTENCNLTIP
jgi:hypothetical protein